MTFPLQPDPARPLHPIVGPDAIGPRNAEEQRIHALIMEAVEGPPSEPVNIAEFIAELRAVIRQRP